MNNKTLMDNLRCIPDFPKKGINFRDVTTLYKNAECMREMMDELYELYKDKGITKIVGIESRGFVMASALAVKLGAGVVLCRKEGKLPAEVVKEIPRGNSGDIGRERKRQKKPWFSRKYYASVMNLRDFLADNIAHEFVGIVARSLDDKYVRYNH